MERDVLVKRSKYIIAEIITLYNSIERDVKHIIADFLDAKEYDLLTEIVLNNMIVNFSSKKKILVYIIRKENTLTDDKLKKLNKSLNVIMNKRNLIAHSDSAILPESNFDWNLLMKNNKNKVSIPKLDFSEPKLTTINDGQIVVSNIEKVYEDFTKHYTLTIELLEEISLKLLK